MINIQADEFLNKLLNGNVECPSDQEKSILIENRDKVIQHINAIFSTEIPRLLEGEQCQNPDKLFWALQLARFLKASETFQWIQKLCYLSTEDIDAALGDFFITEELAYLLADTMNQYNLLKSVIENQNYEEFIRRACLDALIFSVVNGHIDRSEVIDYFKSLFHKILNGEIDDTSLCTHLISSCTDIWPGECLEEIRESFGLNLVEEDLIGIDFVLKYFAEGKESCIEQLKAQIEKHSVWKDLPKFTEPSDENRSQNLNKLLKISNQATNEATRAIKEPGRNELCTCGSGKKYKKCCLNKLSLSDSSDVGIEESIISYEPLENSDLNTLSETERKSILNLYHVAKENPEEVLEVAPMYIKKYPHIPMLYNFLYTAYCMLDRYHEAINLMKKTIQIFPDYLFGRIEYAAYLLRRGEPEKALTALENAKTLSQLYPERKIFHISEWEAFAYVLGCCMIQKGDIKQAKIYLGLIQKATRESHKAYDLQDKIKKEVFHQSMEKQLHELKQQSN